MTPGVEERVSDGALLVSDEACVVSKENSDRGNTDENASGQTCVDLNDVRIGKTESDSLVDGQTVFQPGDDFLTDFHTFSKTRGPSQRDSNCPPLDPVDLISLWNTVQQKGGYDQVETKSLWEAVVGSCTDNRERPGSGEDLKARYEASGLLSFEQYLRSGQAGPEVRHLSPTGHSTLGWEEGHVLAKDAGTLHAPNTMQGLLEGVTALGSDCFNDEGHPNNIGHLSSSSPSCPAASLPREGAQPGTRTPEGDARYPSGTPPTSQEQYGGGLGGQQNDPPGLPLPLESDLAGRGGHSCGEAEETNTEEPGQDPSLCGAVGPSQEGHQQQYSGAPGYGDSTWPVSHANGGGASGGQWSQGAQGAIQWQGDIMQDVGSQGGSQEGKPQDLYRPVQNGEMAPLQGQGPGEPYSQGPPVWGNGAIQQGEEGMKWEEAGQAVPQGRVEGGYLHAGNGAPGMQDMFGDGGQNGPPRGDSGAYPGDYSGDNAHPQPGSAPMEAGVKEEYPPRDPMPPMSLAPGALQHAYSAPGPVERYSTEQYSGVSSAHMTNTDIPTYSRPSSAGVSSRTPTYSKGPPMLGMSGPQMQYPPVGSMPPTYDMGGPVGFDPRGGPPYDQHGTTRGAPFEEMHPRARAPDYPMRGEGPHGRVFQGPPGHPMHQFKPPEDQFREAPPDHHRGFHGQGPMMGRPNQAPLQHMQRPFADRSPHPGHPVHQGPVAGLQGGYGPPHPGHPGSYPLGMQGPPGPMGINKGPPAMYRKPGMEMVPPGGGLGPKRASILPGRPMMMGAMEGPSPLIEDHNGPQLKVICGELPGSFMLNTHQIMCLCESCVRKQQATGQPALYRLVDFERHAGLGARKKWKTSIKVDAGDRNTGLGDWLVKHNITVEVQRNTKDTGGEPKTKMNASGPPMGVSVPPPIGAPPLPHLPPQVPPGPQYKPYASQPFAPGGYPSYETEEPLDMRRPMMQQVPARVSSSGGPGVPPPRRPSPMGYPMPPAMHLEPSRRMAPEAPQTQGYPTHQLPPEPSHIKSAPSGDEGATAHHAEGEESVEQENGSEANQMTEGGMSQGGSVGVKRPASKTPGVPGVPTKKAKPAVGDVTLKGDGYQILRAEEPPGFEVLCLAPGYMIDEIKIKCWDDGRLLIKASPKDERNAQLWNIHPIERHIKLPGTVNARSAQALMTLHGQLYIRINDA